MYSYVDVIIANHFYILDLKLTISDAIARHLIISTILKHFKTKNTLDLLKCLVC